MLRPATVPPMSIGARIAAARQSKRWSQAKLAEAVGAAQTTVSSWERERTEPSRDDVSRIADALGVPLSILEALGESTDSVVPLVGYVGAGAVATLFRDSQGPFDQVLAPRDATQNTVAVEVRGASLGPAFDQAVIFYDDVRSPVTPDLHGRLCVVGLTDGRVLVKILRAGADGRYHLLSNTAEEPLLDQDIAWAARVKDIRPR